MTRSGGSHAADWASVTLQVLQTPYPYSSGHVSRHADDNDVTPWALHPAFHGALDWHSSAHMQWSLVRLLTVAPDELETAGLRHPVCSLLDSRLTPDAIDTEIAYLRDHPSFERPYGWAWAAMLAAATAGCPLPRSAPWAAACSGLASQVAAALLAFLPKLGSPVRHGVHSNTAFAMTLCHQAFSALGRGDVVTAIERWARIWYQRDRAVDTAGEPSGVDFLSPALCEAELMRRVMPPDEFRGWFVAFLPELGGGGPQAASHQHLLRVPHVRDGTDGQLAHLYGLALSRSWALTHLGSTLPAGSAQRSSLESAAHSQFEAALPAVVSGHFMATHWLVSFALLAATAVGNGPGSPAEE